MSPTPLSLLYEDAHAYTQPAVCLATLIACLFTQHAGSYRANRQQRYLA